MSVSYTHLDVYKRQVQDLQNALKDQNRESAAGVLGQQPVQGLDITIPITTQGRLSTVGQFEDIVVRANANGSIIRLKDVARVSLSLIHIFVIDLECATDERSCFRPVQHQCRDAYRKYA